MVLNSELTYTKNSLFCPKPEYWNSPDIQATENEVSELVGSFVRALQPELVIETGTYLGHTTKIIGESLNKNGHGRCISLELDEKMALISKEKTSSLPVEIICTSSIEWLKNLKQNVDFAWLDSAINTRAIELELLYPNITTGGIIGIHDTGPQHKTEVYLKPVLEKINLSCIKLRTPRGVSFYQKN
jgi:predicted O-methyltransferase YrrM